MTGAEPPQGLAETMTITCTRHPNYGISLQPAGLPWSCSREHLAPPSSLSAPKSAHAAATLEELVLLAVRMVSTLKGHRVLCLPHEGRRARSHTVCDAGSTRTLEPCAAPAKRAQSARPWHLARTFLAGFEDDRHAGSSSRPSRRPAQLEMNLDLNSSPEHRSCTRQGRWVCLLIIT